MDRVAHGYRLTEADVGQCCRIAGLCPLPREQHMGAFVLKVSYSKLLTALPSVLSAWTAVNGCVQVASDSSLIDSSKQWRGSKAIGKESSHAPCNFFSIKCHCGVLTEMVDSCLIHTPAPG